MRMHMHVQVPVHVGSSPPDPGFCVSVRNRVAPPLVACISLPAAVGVGHASRSRDAPITNIDIPPLIFCFHYAVLMGSPEANVAGDRGGPPRPMRRPVVAKPDIPVTVVI